jgi:hypothetical protein
MMRRRHENRRGNARAIGDRVWRRKWRNQKRTKLMVELAHGRRAKRRGNNAFGLILVLLERANCARENALARGAKQRLGGAHVGPANAQDLAAIEVKAVDLVVGDDGNKVASTRRWSLRTGRGTRSKSSLKRGKSSTYANVDVN